MLNRIRNLFFRYSRHMECIAVLHKPLRFAVLIVCFGRRIYEARKETGPMGIGPDLMQALSF